MMPQFLRELRPSEVVFGYWAVVSLTEEKAAQEQECFDAAE